MVIQSDSVLMKLYKNMEEKQLFDTSAFILGIL